METIEIEWKGQRAKVKPSQAFEVADAIERHCTVGELALMRSMPGRIRYAALAKAYAAMLQTVGIPATAKEVHEAFTAALRSATEENRLSYAIQTLDWLLLVLMDGAPEPEGKSDAPGK